MTDSGGNQVSGSGARSVGLVVLGLLLAIVGLVFLKGASACRGYASISGDATPHDPTNQCRVLNVNDDVILTMHPHTQGDQTVRSPLDLQIRGRVDSVDPSFAVVSGQRVECSQIAYVHRKMTPLQCGADSVRTIATAIVCLVSRNSCPWS